MLTSLKMLDSDVVPWSALHSVCQRVGDGRGSLLAATQVIARGIDSMHCLLVCNAISTDTLGNGRPCALPRTHG